MKEQGVAVQKLEDLGNGWTIKYSVRLHEHVWQVALQQLNDGASITAIQGCNQELCHAKLYHNQATHDPLTANVCYEFLDTDSSRLYKKYSSAHGIDVAEAPQYNIDNWLNPNSPAY
ncbi:hypothetical protein JB92DRAFT_2824413 [Gautieria morchelliformis]|nr:hypothetical protein JB92DRAFT_2824413 [Gautieria morchelliformis]